jgi:hypothetical protein
MNMGSLRTLVSRPALLAAALLVALPAGAEMYKWVDDNGVVTYSDTPPTSKQPKKVEAVAERVSVYTPDAQINKAMAADPRRDAKIASLERQLEAERRAKAGTQPTRAGASERQAAAYQRCVSERGVDCEAIRTGGTAGTTSGYGYSGESYGSGYLPYVVIGARNPPPPFAVLSTPQSVVGINPAPPAGISTAPPVGAQPAGRTRSASGGTLR